MVSESSAVGEDHEEHCFMAIQKIVVLTVDEFAFTESLKGENLRVWLERLGGHFLLVWLELANNISSLCYSLILVLLVDIKL